MTVPSFLGWWLLGFMVSCWSAEWFDGSMVWLSLLSWDDGCLVSCWSAEWFDGTMAWLSLLSWPDGCLVSWFHVNLQNGLTVPWFDCPFFPGLMVAWFHGFMLICRMVWLLTPSERGRCGGNFNGPVCIRQHKILFHHYKPPNCNLIIHILVV